MRVLFYLSDPRWTGCARAFLVGAAGLARRGHTVTIACCGGSLVERHAQAAGLDVVATDAEASTVGGAWDLRRVLQERFIEVAFVHSDREQFLVSSAMRLAERGGVIRRVPSFENLALLRSGRLALRMAATGAVFTTERALREANGDGLQIPPAIAPLGVDPSTYDAVTPVPREALGAPEHGLLIVCSADRGARLRVTTVFRTVKLLAVHHPELHLVLVGPGSLDEDLRMHAAALNISHYVTYLGEREDERSVLRAADVGWVVAGQDDGAWAFLDFMSMRTPVLADRGALQQHYVADGITGVLLAPADPSQTASAVAAFLASEERRTAMGNAARTRVQREFPEQAMIDGFERAVVAAGDRSRWTSR